MTDPYQPQIDQLKQEIGQREAELARFEQTVLALEREIDAFRARYDQIVGPAQTKAQVARQALDELERSQRLTHTPTQYTLPADFVPVEEQMRRVWGDPGEAPARPPRQVTTFEVDTEPLEDRSAQIKRLFRSLARRFHPDFGRDPAERAQRTQLMALINEAYQREDLEALRTLEAKNIEIEQIHRQVGGDSARAAQASLSLLVLRDLWQRRATLDAEFERLKAYHAELLNGMWMKLKLDAKLAQRQGRDLLRDLAADYEREMLATLRELDQRRHA